MAENSSIEWSVVSGALEQVAKDLDVELGRARDEELVMALWVAGELVEGPEAEELSWPGVRLRPEGLYLCSEDEDAWEQLWDWVAAECPEQLSTLVEWGEDVVKFPRYAKEVPRG